KAALASTLEAANQKLTADQAKLDVMNGGPTDEDIRQARAAVLQAQQALVKAQRPGAETDLAQQQAVVDQMSAQLQAKQTPYTDADLQAAVATVAQAEAAVAVAQASLDQMTVVAPFDGIVSQRLLGPGSLASSATPVVVLTSDEVEIHVTVEEARVGQVRPGQGVQLTVPAYPGVTFPAKVITIAPTGDARAHTFDAKIVPDSQDDRLLPGMYAQVSVVAAQKPDATLVPKEAIVQQGSNQIVFVNDNGRASQRQVQTGMTDDKSVEITGGVAAGEQVVVVGQNGLRDGVPIQVASTPAPGQGQGQGQRGQGSGGGGQGQGQAGQGQGQGQRGGGQGQAGQGAQQGDQPAQKPASDNSQPTQKPDGG
ncbi:MAG TPA: efflux RND transporter periplasmic adaptor subunit, partial [Chloroflexota bacterium]|nr:efflux RND transporter periplasmic adaptor subunit [Chloroflexota bacterium]